MVRNDDPRWNTMLQTVIVLGPATLALSFVTLFARHNVALIELLTPLFVLMVDAMLILVNSTEICGEVTKEMRQTQIYYITLGYIIASLYMGASWLYGIIARFVFFLSLLALILYRVQ